jgi:hypothetical protein
MGSNWAVLALLPPVALWGFVLIEERCRLIGRDHIKIRRKL